MKDTEVKLHIDNSVVPVSQNHRRIPFHQRKDLEDCLQTLLRQDIIESADGPTAWINPVVLVPKKQGGVRPCIDMRMANKAIKHEQHVMPTLDEVILDLNGATIFSNVDIKSGYHQLVLSEDSRNITTSTHIGLYHYKRLGFGINAAAEKFQQMIQTAISDLPNSKTISDDIIIFGRNRQEHDVALHKLLQRLQSLGLTLNKEKCQFHLPRVMFFGWVFSSEGIKPDPTKVYAIINTKLQEMCQNLTVFLA